MEQVKLVIETTKGFVRNQSPMFDVKGDFTQNNDLMKYLRAYSKKIKDLNEEYEASEVKNKAFLRVVTTSLKSNLPKQIIDFSKVMVG